MNGINYKTTVRKLHDTGRKNSFSTVVDVYMLGYGYVVSQYSKFYDQDLEKYQVLPRQYLGSFEGDNR